MKCHIHSIIRLIQCIQDKNTGLPLGREKKAIKFFQDNFAAYYLPKFHLCICICHSFLFPESRQTKKKIHYLLFFRISCDCPPLWFVDCTSMVSLHYCELQLHPSARQNYRSKNLQVIHFKQNVKFVFAQKFLLSMQFTFFSTYKFSHIQLSHIQLSHIQLSHIQLSHIQLRFVSNSLSLALSVILKPLSLDLGSISNKLGYF